MSMLDTTVYPLILATALRVITIQKQAKPEDLSPFRTQVKIKPDSKFNEDGRGKGEQGEVIAASPQPSRLGWAFVKFHPSGFRNWFRIGMPEIQDGACDLDLADSELEKHVVISYANQFYELPTSGFSIEPGDIVKLSKDKDSLCICGVEKAKVSGAIAFIAQKIDEEFAVVDLPGGRRTVSVGKFTGNQLEESGRVVLDSSLSVIVQNLGFDDGSFAVDETEMVAWDMVFGQDEARDRIKEALEGAALYPALYKMFHKKPPTWFLLWGPPGCGKTMLAKAAYSSYAAACKARGISLSSGFILVSGPEILSKYVGVAEAAIRHIFARARKFAKKNGIPAFIFIDECESIAADRNSGVSSDVLKTIVPAFLAEMNGVRQAGCIVMMATNKPDTLDAAFREGRIDLNIEIVRPNRDSARKIFASNLKGLPVSGATFDEILDLAVSELFSDKYVIYTITKSDKSEIKFTLANVVNGAMIASGVVEEVKRLAIERNKGKDPSVIEGITSEDVVSAVKAIHASNLSRNHAEALGDFTKSFQDQIVAVDKLTRIQS